MSDFNRQVIEEFRAKEGKVGGYFDGKKIALLTTTGAKSGQPRTSPLGYFPIDGKTYIVASKGGADADPDWYRKLVATPSVTVEIGTERFEATARVLARAERDAIYPKVVEIEPAFGDYERKTNRVIPVVEIVRR